MNRKIRVVCCLSFENKNSLSMVMLWNGVPFAVFHFRINHTCEYIIQMMVWHAPDLVFLFFFFPVWKIESSFILCNETRTVWFRWTQQFTTNRMNETEKRQELNEREQNDEYILFALLIQSISVCFISFQSKLKRFWL